MKKNNPTVNTGPVRRKGPQKVKNNPIKSNGSIFRNPYKRGK